MISLADGRSAGSKSRGVDVTPLPRCHVNVAVARVLSWKCWGHVGDMSATRNIVGKFRRHGLSLPTTHQQGACVMSQEHVCAPFYFTYPTRVR
jgi:hypothetical protein